LKNQFGLLLLALLMNTITSYGVSVQKMTCDYRVNPLVVTTERLFFGWELASQKVADAQTAYRILVSSSAYRLKKGLGDLWDSGKIVSNQSQQVPYAGVPLSAGQTCFWTVQVWDVNDKPAGKSSLSTFTISLSEDQLHASWIGAITKADSYLPQGRTDWHGPSFKKEAVRNAYAVMDTLSIRSIQLRKSCLFAKKVTEAKLYISGLGHYELHLNGQKIGNSVFAPLWSDYDKTVYYNTFDVTAQLKKGENVFGVLLGNGFYNAVGNRYNKIWVSFGPPTLFFQLELTYVDGSRQIVLSDASWKYDLSPITFNNIYGGESYDARLEQPGWDRPGFDDRNWKPVVVQDAPKGILRAETAPVVQEMKSYPVQSAKRIDAGTHVLNMGQNISGYPLIKVQGPRGSKIKIVPGEMLQKDLVSQKRSGGPCFYEYTLKGEGVETWSPKFNYYGFQYLEIDSADLYKAEPGSQRPVVRSVQSQFVYNSTPETGTFTCSNDLYNRTHMLIQNAVKSNFQAVFTDCPHREKLGWLEEDYLNGPGLFYNYDLTTFIPKLMQDIRDGQNANGLVPSIIPEYVVFGGDFSDSPEWGVASIIVPYMYYEYYGDASLIRSMYSTMKRYVDFLTTRSDSGIVSYGLGDWYDYGSHAAGYSQNSPIAISATSHYYYAIDYLIRSAKLVGNWQDEQHYRQLLDFVKESYNRRFFNAETKQYGTGSQFCNAVSLYMGLVKAEDKDAVLQNLIADVEKHGNRLTTGDIGNRYLFQTLADNDRNDVMYALTNHYDVPGYGFQLQFGATTLTEQWDPRRGNSWNHFMMGQIDEWFFKTLAGIQSDPEKPGYQHFFVKPIPVGNVNAVSATYRTLYGVIGVSWRKIGDSIEIDVQVPVNTTASLLLPYPALEFLLNGKVYSNNGLILLQSGENKLIEKMKANNIY
jgi:alpha-L-rhamnosidase